MENRIAAEVAEQELERWAEGMDVDMDEGSLDEEDLATLIKAKSVLTRALCRGSLTINDNDEAVYTPWRPKSKYKEPITFGERTGRTVLALDKGKKGHQAAKAHAAMADITGLDAAIFRGLAGTDCKVCETLFALLMD